MTVRFRGQMLGPVGEMLGMAPARVAVVSDNGPGFAETFSRPGSTDYTGCWDTSAPGYESPRTATLAWFDVGQGRNALNAVALDEPRVGSLDRVLICIERCCVADSGQEG